MQNRNIFVNIIDALPEWVSRGIITEKQKEEILEIYPPPKKIEKKTFHLPVIMVILSLVLITIGLFMFYQANWKYLSVTIKLIHVFTLLIGFYSLSYYFNVKKGADHWLTRTFLIIGMAYYGACIGLIAQIYHISDRPVNAILIWALMALATSIITKEKSGLFLSTALLFTWNIWEISIYGSGNYFFGPLILILGYTFYRWKTTPGLITTFILMIFYFYQVHFSTLSRTTSELFKLGFALIHISYGVLLILLKKTGDGKKELSSVLNLSEIFGWIFIFISLASISWPITFTNHRILLLNLFGSTKTLLIPVEFILLSTGLIFIYYGFSKMKKFLDIFPFILLYSIITFFLPMGHKTILMVSTHIGILLFIFGFLYSSYRTANIDSTRKVMAIVLTGSFVFIKCVGFIIAGLNKKEYLICYIIGFIIFAIICLLINQIIRFLLKSKNMEFPDKILNLIITILLFFAVYSLSFELPAQNSIFNTNEVIITLLFIFLLITVCLFIWLWKIATEKLIVIISGIIFFITVFTLLIANPSLSWVVYSLIFNLLLFVIEGAVIYTGTKYNSKSLVILGINFFILHVITRYFDIIWDMLSGSALFISTGILVLGVGYMLNKQRKKIFKRIDSNRSI